MSTTSKTGIVQSYLFFDGRCEEALNFYTAAVGARIEALMRFKDSPDPSFCMPGVDKDKVMHANFRIGDTQLMASDGRCGGKLNFEGFALSLSVPDASQAQRVFAALADGGQVQMPLARTFYSPCFGMLTDRFGVSWMIIVPGEYSPK